jgi:hypothetical protein
MPSLSSARDRIVVSLYPNTGLPTVATSPEKTACAA